MEERELPVVVQSTAVQTHQDEEPSIAAMLQAAIAAGMAPDALEKMVGLYERMDARRAERAYAEALCEFQRRCPKLDLNKTVFNKDGRTVRYKYATLDHIMATLRPVLDECGFSVSWDSRIEGGSVHATAIVRHKAGHSTRTEFSAPIERDAYMNDSQKAGSAMSFAARYAVRLAFGLTPGDVDDDAGAANAKPIDEEKVANIEGLLDEVSADKPKFLRFMGVSAVSEIQERDYHRAVSALERKRGER